MPSTVSDARDMLIAAVLSKDPVIYFDDRWLYDLEDELEPIVEKDISDFKPKILRDGKDLTIIGTSFSTKLALDSAEILEKQGISAEVADVRTLSPFDYRTLVESVDKTKRFIVIDGGWKNSGFSAEIISSIIENIKISKLKASPRRITLPDSPAPTSRPLENIYYPSVENIVKDIVNMLSV